MRVEHRLVRAYGTGQFGFLLFGGRIGIGCNRQGAEFHQAGHEQKARLDGGKVEPATTYG